MNPLTRDIQEAEKPGRLQLAILEWQRQLARRRDIQMASRTESRGGVGDLSSPHVLHGGSAAA